MDLRKDREEQKHTPVLCKTKSSSCIHLLFFIMIIIIIIIKNAIMEAHFGGEKNLQLN